MASYCDVTNSVYPVTMTTIRHCSILEFGRGAANQAVDPGITRPLHTTERAHYGMLVHGQMSSHAWDNFSVNYVNMFV